MTKDIAVIEKEAADIVNYADMITVRTEEENRLADEFLSTIKTMAKEIDATFKPIIDKQNAALKETRAQMAKHKDPLIEAEELVKGKMKTWYLAEEQKRAEAQAKIDEAARVESERLKKEAAQAAKEGKTETADVLNATASQVQTNRPQAEPVAAKKGGVMKYWTYRITDETKIPRQYMTPNLKLLESQAKASQDKLKIDGIEFYQEVTIVGKSR
jgi:hypothetical protein